MKSLFSLLLLTCIHYVGAKDVIITVGAGNGTMVFSPQSVNASLNDVVVFQFTNGTHSATQSDFPTPCIPISITNTTINGFDSGLRPAVSPPTELRVNIDSRNNGTPIFYFDSANGSCGMGAVGVINVNASSEETLDGFVRNAERLNGTQATETISSSSSGSTPTSPATTSPSPTNTSQASRIFLPAAFSSFLVSFALLMSML